MRLLQVQSWKSRVASPRLLPETALVLKHLCGQNSCEDALGVVCFRVRRLPGPLESMLRTSAIQSSSVCQPVMQNG